LLALDNGTSSVYLEGVTSSNSADACLASVLTALKKGTGVTNVAPLNDETGAAIGGTSSDRSYAVYAFDYAGKDGAVNYNEYIDCRPVDAGKSMLAITSLVLADKFSSQVDPLLKLLGNLSLTGGGVTTGGNGSDSNGTGNASGGGGTASAGDITTFIKATEGDINGFWTREFPLISNHGAYTPPAKLVTFDTAIDTGCGPIKARDVGQVGPFYCPSDKVIYYDLKFAEFQLQQFNNNRSVISVAMAHELGHHIQQLAGWKECTNTPCLDPQEMTSQEIELQADCFAGAWTADAEGRGRLGSFDVETNIAQFATLLGDQTGNSNTADAQVHGNGAIRTYWFLGGYYKGATECLTVSAATDPARHGAGVDATPTAGNSGDLNNPGATTPTPATTSPGTGAPIAIGDKFSVAFGSGTANATITATDVQASVGKNVIAKGQFLIVYFDIATGAKAGLAFDYSTFTVTDSAGKTSDADAAATDALLKTSPDLPDGTAQNLDPNTTYKLAVVFDVSKVATGFTLATADGAVSVTLDR